MEMWVFHACESDDAIAVHEKLPSSHMFGDLHSVLKSGACLRGAEDHDSYVSLDLRRKTRCRSTIFYATIHSNGGYGPVPRKIVPACPVYVCLSSVPDWSNLRLDPEIISPCDKFPTLMGSQHFNAIEYMNTVVKDIRCALKGLKTLAQDRFWIKIAPLAMSLNIQSQEGVYIASYAAFWYTQALALALQEVSNEWVYAVEVIDFQGISNIRNTNLQLPGVRIVYPSTRDILDFRGCPGNVMPACIVPVDSFAAPWTRKDAVRKDSHFECLAAAVCNNTDVHEHADEPLAPTFVRIKL